MFPASTRGRYIPGVGYAITRANIADEQARRVKDKEDPATPADVVNLFVRLANRGGIDTRRELARATRLMRNG